MLAEPAAGAQHRHVRGPPVGAGELRGEVEDAAHVRAAEGVDRLVGVADDGEVAAVAGERTQQRHLAGVGVLVLVDEHVAQPGAQLVAVPLGLHDGAGDEVGVVDGAGAVEDVEVLRQEPSRGDVRVDAVVETEPGQLLGPQPLLARPPDHRVDLAREAAGADRLAQRGRPGHRLGRVGEQLLQDHVLLGRGQQPQRGGVEVGGGEAPDEAVGVGVEGRAQRRRHGAAEPGGDPVAQLLGRLAAEGQREHRLGAGAALLDPVDDGLDQRRGLAGARTGEHQQRAAGVVDHGPLVGVELGGRDRRGAGRCEAVRRHGLITSSAADRNRRRPGDGPALSGARARAAPAATTRADGSAAAARRRSSPGSSARW